MHVAVVGGSDAGIEAARRILTLDPSVEVSLLVADAFPNFSICGIPYYVSGEVPDWRDLAHRTEADLEAAGIRLLLDHRVTALGLDRRSLQFTTDGDTDPGTLAYDRLIVATGAHPVVPPIDGLAALGPDDGVFVIHTMPDTFAVQTAVRNLDEGATVAIIGAG